MSTSMIDGEMEPAGSRDEAAAPEPDASAEADACGEERGD
jgi:hypothetical protein